MQPLITMIDHYRPGFSVGIKPADPGMVADLEKLAGPLPGAYRRFLATMGRSTNGFEPGGADFSVEDRLLNYQLSPADRDSRYLLVGAGGSLEPGGDLYMDRSQPCGHDDCELVIAAFGPKLDESTCEPLQAGLEEFLYVEAFRQYRLPLLPAGPRLTPMAEVAREDEIIERLVATAEQMQFIRVGPAHRSALLDRVDAAMMLRRQSPSGQFELELKAATPELLNTILDQLTVHAPFLLDGRERS